MGPAKAALEACTRTLAAELVRAFLSFVPLCLFVDDDGGICCLFFFLLSSFFCWQGCDQVRVNAISAGPLNTLAARGIANFTVRAAPCRSARTPCQRHALPPCVVHAGHARSCRTRGAVAATVVSGRRGRHGDLPCLGHVSFRHGSGVAWCVGRAHLWVWVVCGCVPRVALDRLLWGTSHT